MVQPHQSVTVRSQLVDAIKDLLPRKWKLVPYNDSLDTLETTTVMLQQMKITPAPSNPSGARMVTFTVTIIAASTDAERSEYELDDGVLTLFDILSGIKWINATDATKVLYNASHIAYDISIQVITAKD